MLQFVAVCHELSPEELSKVIVQAAAAFAPSVPIAIENSTVCRSTRANIPPPRSVSVIALPRRRLQSDRLLNVTVDPSARAAASASASRDGALTTHRLNSSRGANTPQSTRT